MEARALRLFLGLPLPPEAGEALGRWQRERPDIEGWSRTAGLHLTLAFLGGRGPEALPVLESCAAAVARRHETFELFTTDLGSFPKGGATRILWLGLAPCPALENLAADLRETLATAGEAFDAKPFRPHLTLARFRRGRAKGGVGLTSPPSLRFTADRLALFESRPQGCYAPLRTWRLGEV